jgi:hypothetical protein
MFFIGFYKGSPSDYIIKFKKGKPARKGRGISFFFSKRKSTIISIPAKTLDALFIFDEVTKSYQPITMQGQLTFQIVDFEKISKLLDFSINLKTKAYNTNDYDKLLERIVNSAQMAAKDAIKEMELEQALAGSTEIAAHIMKKMKNDPLMEAVGIEIIGVVVTAIKTSPETSKALEAEYREMLLKKSDQAIYARRAAAVEQERVIKENEMNSQIEIERKKKELVDLEGNNTVKSAEYNAKALDMEFSVYKNMGSDVLLALGFKGIGEKVTHINNLNLTPELLTEILNLKGK